MTNPTRVTQPDLVRTPVRAGARTPFAIRNRVAERLCFSPIVHRLGISNRPYKPSRLLGRVRAALINRPTFLPRIKPYGIVRQVRQSSGSITAFAERGFYNRGIRHNFARMIVFFPSSGRAKGLAQCLFIRVTQAAIL
jgi:hypothetical protein